MQGEGDLARFWVQTTRVGALPPRRIVQSLRAPGVLSANLLRAANCSLCNKVDTPSVRIRRVENDYLKADWLMRRNRVSCLC